MRSFTAVRFIALGLCLTVVGCMFGSSSSPEQSLSDDSIKNAFASGISSMSQALKGSSSGFSTSSSVALKNIKPRFSLIPSAYAILGAGGCSDSDPDVTLTISCSDSLHTSTVIRDFGEGCDIDEDTVVTGREYIGWTNMGSPACSGGRRPDFWTAVQGTGAQQIFSTDPDSPESPVTAIVRNYDDQYFTHVVGRIVTDYANYSSSEDTESVEGTVTIPGTSRIRYDSDQTKILYDHTVSTSTPLAILMSKTGENAPVRTAVSGQVDVSHNLAAFTVHHSPQNVKFDYNQCECYPVSGTLTVTVTDNNTSEQIGSGTIQFTAEETGTCDTMEITYEGRQIHVPTLDRCR